MFGTADFTGIMIFFLGFIDKSSSTNEIKWMKIVWSNIVKCISILGTYSDILLNKLAIVSVAIINLKNFLHNSE